MNRYPSTLIRKETSGPRYFGSTKYPPVDFTIEDFYIISMQGDRLDNLAFQFYNDSTLWWIISYANPDLPKDSLYPPLGYQLRIPIFDVEILRDLENLNS